MCELNLSMRQYLQGEILICESRINRVSWIKGQLDEITTARLIVHLGLTMKSPDQSPGGVNTGESLSLYQASGLNGILATMVIQ